MLHLYMKNAPKKNILSISKKQKYVEPDVNSEEKIIYEEVANGRYYIKWTRGENNQWKYVDCNVVDYDNYRNLNKDKENKTPTTEVNNTIYGTTTDGIRMQLTRNLTGDWVGNIHSVGSENTSNNHTITFNTYEFTEADGKIQCIIDKTTNEEVYRR